MRFDRSMVEGPYLRDILAQPGALEDTVAALAAAPELPKAAGFDRVVLTGMGASYHALHPLHIKLVDHGFQAEAFETSELLYYYAAALNRRTLLIVVSQSGQSAEIVRLLDRIPVRVRTLGVTNTPDSPLATRADSTILTRAGAESTVSCKTFVATLAALESLGAALCGADRTETESVLRRHRRSKATFPDGKPKWRAWSTCWTACARYSSSAAARPWRPPAREA